MKTLYPASVLALGLAALVVGSASCAESNDQNSTPPDASTIPDPSSADAGASPDASVDIDAACADAGDGGCTTQVLTCDEADFCAVPTNTDDRYALTGVWGSSANDVWAVGSAGTIVHWDGSAWSLIPSGRKDTLFSVWGSSANDVWISSSRSVILHSAGLQGGTASFTLEEPLDPDDPTNWMGISATKVWGTSASNVFVAGPAGYAWPPNSLWRRRVGFGGDPGADYIWDGASTFCQDYSVACPDVNSVWGTSENDLWVASNDGKIIHSNGPVGNGGSYEQWTTLKTTLTTKNLLGVWGTSASDVWFVGDEGTIRHWSNDPTQRFEIVESNTTEKLRAVWGASANDVWAAGDNGTIIHWDGTSWTNATATLPAGPKPRLYAIWGSGPNDVWIVGEAIALHYTGPKKGSR